MCCSFKAYVSQGACLTKNFTGNPVKRGAHNLQSFLLLPAERRSSAPSGILAIARVTACAHLGKLPDLAE